MTPAARVAAAIEILDDWLAGVPAEKALTNWARGHRFAGSGDRAAIRDHVFDGLDTVGRVAFDTKLTFACDRTFQQRRVNGKTVYNWVQQR